MTGKSLFGKDGACTPMLKNFIEKALAAAMESHLSDFERSQGNKRNGKSTKLDSAILFKPTNIIRVYYLLNCFFNKNI